MWASGNGGRAGDSCAADGYAMSIYTVTVGAASYDGSIAAFDERCSGKMATTFVTGQHEGLDIVRKMVCTLVLAT